MARERRAAPSRSAHCRACGEPAREAHPEPPASLDAELLTILRGELAIKNEQIAQQMELIKGLSERLREGNVLIGSLQQHLALPEGRRMGAPPVAANLKRTLLPHRVPSSPRLPSQRELSCPDSSDKLPMPAPTILPAGTVASPSKRYRLPGIEREGIAQLSLLETALWPLRGGKRPTHTFETAYTFMTPAGRTSAAVTVRAPSGLQPIDEFVLWGLLGATLSRRDAQPSLLATPYWMLRHLRLKTGGSQYNEFQESLLRLAFTSYQNTGFYNPETQEHEFTAFQFLSIFLPTVGGVGQTVDNDRCWRIEWNPAFFRFCRATGGNLLFDLDLYQTLTPASRRLFLKLKDRFWRSKRVFMNVDDLTINGLGFSATRPLAKRKFDLTNCIRELLDQEVLCLGRGQTDPKELFLKRGKGSYVVTFYEGEYFHRRPTERILRQLSTIAEDPLYEPLRKIGVDGPAIRRLFHKHSRSLVQRWINITDAAMHEHPRGFPGFRVSPAAFLMDGVQHRRTPPDWIYAHEKRQERAQWERDRAHVAHDEQELRSAYAQERKASLKTYLESPEGRAKYDQTYGALLALYRATEPHRCQDAAHEATVARLEQQDFQFPQYPVWALARQRGSVKLTS